MITYTADDGLRVLTYLHLTNLTAAEINTFRLLWEEVYRRNSGNPVLTIWKLYSEVVPFTCCKDERAAMRVARARDADFEARLVKSGLKERLDTGEPLEEIMAGFYSREVH